MAAAALALLLLLGACAPGTRGTDAEITSATPIADVLAPRFELPDGSAAIERFDPPGAGAGLVLAFATTVRNPNDFPVSVDHVDYAVLLNGTVVTRGTVSDLLTLGPGAAGLVEWRVDADLAPHRALWRPVVDTFAGAGLAFEVQGTVRFSSQSYAFTSGRRTLLAGEARATQEVRAPRLRLDGRESRLTVVRPDAPVVTLALLATNSGDVGYFVTGRGIQLELNGVVVAEVDLGPVPVPAGETGGTDLVFIVDRARLDDAAREALDDAIDGVRASVVVRGAFAYDVLGVDSYPVPIGSGLTTTIPSSHLPAAAVGATDDDDDLP